MKSLSLREKITMVCTMCVVLILLLMVGRAHALTYGNKEWTSVDWQVPGDDLLTRDHETGRLWLDISAFSFTWDQLQEELAPGGSLSEFRLASYADVQEFLGGFQGQTEHSGSLVNTLFDDIWAVFGVEPSPFDWGPGDTFTISAWVADEHSEPDYANYALMSVEVNPNDVYVFEYGFLGDGAPREESKGAWLYKQGDSQPPIPEPGTLILLGSGLFGLLALRRKTTKKPLITQGIFTTLRKITMCVVLALLLLAGAAHALTYGNKEWTGVDWQAPGDGLLTKDHETGRLWLDISTFSFTWDQLGEELAPGGSLSEFTLASYADVQEFLGGFQGSVEYNGDLGDILFDNIWARLGLEPSPFDWEPDNTYMLTAWVADEHPDPDYANYALMGVEVNPNDVYVFEYGSLGDGAPREESKGAWLYKQGDSQPPIPEPGTLILLGTGLFGLLALRRKTTKRE